MSATATATATPTATGATMAQIRAHNALTRYFGRDAGRDTAATENGKVALSSALDNMALSLTGAAIMRAHSGNDGGQILAAEVKAMAFKVKATRDSRIAAVDVARAGKPRHMAGATLAAFVAYAEATHGAIMAALTPAPAPAKPKAPAINWKERAMAAEAAHAAAIAHAETLAAMLAAHGMTAPALPVGATLAPTNVTEDAPM